MNQRIKAICVFTAIFSFAQCAFAEGNVNGSSTADGMVYVPNSKYLGASKPAATPAPASVPKGTDEFGYKPNAKYLPAPHGTKSGG